MKTAFAMSLAATLAFATAASAAMPQRIRGSLVSATQTAITVRTTSGATDVIALTPVTRYVAASKASLADVQPGKFIGTATKDVGGQQVALEVSIFPEAMRGTGEGHYAWDSLPGAGAGASSMMTNGNIAAVAPGHKAATSMTNGNVRASSVDGAAKTLTVTYKGGTQTILVPPTAPVVMLAPAGRSVLRPGVSVLVFAIGVPSHSAALAVTVGKDGLTLPM